MPLLRIVRRHSQTRHRRMTARSGGQFHVEHCVLKPKSTATKPNVKDEQTSRAQSGVPSRTRLLLAFQKHQQRVFHVEHPVGMVGCSAAAQIQHPISGSAKLAENRADRAVLTVF